MRSVTTERFRKAYMALPVTVKTRAKEAYQRWKKNPFHASLNFKQIHDSLPIFAVRIGLNYRALRQKGQEHHDLVLDWIARRLQYPD